MYLETRNDRWWYFLLKGDVGGSTVFFRVLKVFRWIFGDSFRTAQYNASQFIQLSCILILLRNVFKTISSKLEGVVGETANIARMAELISSDIFKTFGWEVSGSMNINWNCVNSEHQRDTHPADVVYKYPEPYKDIITYVLCDLKSYSKTSINKNTIKKAIENLNCSLSCAKVSTDWKEKYKDTDKNYNIKGMLFIYNHDGEFVDNDQEFTKIISESTKNIKIDKGNCIFIVGPSLIKYLTNVSNNIKILQANSKLPLDKFKIGYYYPELEDRKLCHNTSTLPLSIEHMSANYQVMRYNQKDSNKIDGLDIYMKGNGGDEKSFMHAIDFIRKSNLLQEQTKVRVFVPSGSPEARRNFQKAMSLFTEDLESTLRERMQSLITYEHCPVVVKQQYFNEEIGMRYDK